MRARRKHDLDLLEIANYAPAEAVRFFHVPASTLEYWTTGGSQALVRLASRRPAMLSFKNLVEFYVLEGLRDVHHLNLHRIRKGVEYMINSSQSKHPLADFDIRTDGRYVWFYRDGIPINASKGGQPAFDDIVGPYLKRVSRDPHGMANKIYPFMRKEQIKQEADPPVIVEIDPKRCFGMPVLYGSRITTAFLAGRYRGGDSVPAIAHSYGRPVAEIQEAVEWEIGREIKAA